MPFVTLFIPSINIIPFELLLYLFLVLVIFRHRLAIPSTAAGAECHLCPGTHCHTEWSRDILFLLSPRILVKCQENITCFSENFNWIKRVSFMTSGGWTRSNCHKTIPWHKNLPAFRTAVSLQAPSHILTVCIAVLYSCNLTKWLFLSTYLMQQFFIISFFHQ